MKSIWEKIASNLIWGTILVFVLLAFVVTVYNLTNPTDPFLLSLKDLLIASLTGILGAFVVGLLFKHIELDKIIGKENVKSVLETIFDPKDRIQDIVPSDNLVDFATSAIATAHGIVETDDNFGLVKVCLRETESMLSSPYEIVDITRRYRFDENTPSILHVSETMRATFVNPSENDLPRRAAWNYLTSPKIENSDPEWDKMHVSTTIVDKHQKDENLRYPTEQVLKCTIENDNRVWKNEDENNNSVTFLLPASCNDFVIKIERMFVVPITDRESTFTWEVPLRQLNYSASFEGINVNTKPEVTKCVKCGKMRSCKECKEGVVSLINGKNNAMIAINEWVGSQTGIRITWDIVRE